MSTSLAGTPTSSQEGQSGKEREMIEGLPHLLEKLKGELLEMEKRWGDGGDGKLGLRMAGALKS